MTQQASEPHNGRIAHIQGLRPIEVQEVRDLLELDGISLEVQEDASAQHGLSPDLVVFVLLSWPAIQGIVSWLEKNRHKREIKLIFKVKGSDGSTISREIDVAETESRSTNKTDPSIWTQQLAELGGLLDPSSRLNSPSDGESADRVSE